MKELREAKSFTHKDLAARINDTPKKSLESALIEQGKDMRSAWRVRDEVLGRISVSAETVERWEKVGFGVQRGTREAEFLVVPDGFGGTFLKEMQDVTDADHKAIKTYLEEEAAFVEAESEKLIDNFVREQTINMDLGIESLLDEDESGA